MAKKEPAKVIRPALERVFISEADQYLFGQGTHYDIYKKLGAHPSVEEGQEGMYFAVWAPNAKEVHLVGDFNEWNTSSHCMKKCGPIGIYELFVPGLGEGQKYKFLITTKKEEHLYKADPFANHAEYRPGTASVTTDLRGFIWEDEKWMQERDEKDVLAQPMSVYECHIGSFMKHPDPRRGCLRWFLHQR